MIRSNSLLLSELSTYIRGPPNGIVKCIIAKKTITILMGKLHEALRAANVPEGPAREAAEEVATGYSKLEKGLDAVRFEIADVRLEMDKGFADVRQEVAVLRAETKGELRRLEKPRASFAVLNRCSARSSR
jgi:hypothetical protein